MQINDTIQPIIYNWTEKILSTLFKFLSLEDKSNISKYMKDKNNDNIIDTTSQNTSL